VLLFADNQVIIADTEDNLQRAAHQLNQLITEYGSTISVQKTKSMAFKGQFISQKLLRKHYTTHWLSHCCYMAAKLGLLKQGTLAEYQQQR
jgi:hypothetical protein